MKKLLVISILTLLIFNLIGFVVSFQVLRHEIKWEVRKFLSATYGREDVSFFTFHRNDVLNLKDEFVINDQFYDVISRKIQGDSVVVMCFSDEKETQLMGQFNDYMQKNIAQQTDTEQKTQLFFSHLLKDFLFAHLSHLKSPPSVSALKNAVFLMSTSFYPACFILIDAPPPEDFV